MDSSSSDNAPEEDEEEGHLVTYIWGKPWLLFRSAFDSLRAYVYAVLWSDFAVRESQAENAVFEPDSTPTERRDLSLKVHSNRLPEDYDMGVWRLDLYKSPTMLSNTLSGIKYFALRTDSALHQLIIEDPCCPAEQDAQLNTVVPEITEALNAEVDNAVAKFTLNA